VALLANGQSSGKGRSSVKKFSFVRVLGLVLALSIVVGFAVYVWSGATTNKGTTGAIKTENALILSAEKSSCAKFGAYGSIATLKKEGLLTFTPVYNSVVYLPGKNCGSIVVGSSSYQAPVG
jgi:hypothetical protein